MDPTRITVAHVIAARQELARRDWRAALASLQAALDGRGFDAVAGLSERVFAGAPTPDDAQVLAKIDTAAAERCCGSVLDFLRTVAVVDALH